MSKYLEVLFNDKLHPDDIEVLTSPTRDEPGLARLASARVGSHRSDAPNSWPVHSCAGGLLGFIAEANFIGPPFTDTYLLEEPNG